MPSVYSMTDLYIRYVFPFTIVNNNYYVINDSIAYRWNILFFSEIPKYVAVYKYTINNITYFI